MEFKQQADTYKNTAYYCDCFSQIKVYKNQKKGGEALNQPILLLSVIDLIGQDIIKSRQVLISDQLIETFKKYWYILGSNAFESSDFALPFFHLKNAKGKFWSLKFSDTYEGGRPQSIPKLTRDVDYAILDNNLFSLLQDSNERQEIIDSLIIHWFSSSQRKIEELLDINQDLEDFTNEQQNSPEGKQHKEDIEPRFYLKKSLIRNSFFRKTVVHVYDYKCAFCRIKVTRSVHQNIVDGAHIKPLALFYDSSINNGISLCKNHHWAFDKGWFCIDDRYRIIVAKDLTEESAHSRLMKDHNGESILLPSSEQFFPSIEATQWHLKNIFKA